MQHSQRDYKEIVKLLWSFSLYKMYKNIYKMPSLCRKGQTYLACRISGSDKKNPSWIKDS